VLGSRFVLDLFNAVQPLHSALDYHLERHNVLASNIAHVDTPGYRPRDLARVSPSFQSVMIVALERTSDAHLPGSSTVGEAANGRVFTDAAAGVGNDGNAVSLDREAAKLAANNLRYDVISAVMAGELRQLSYAANDAKG